MKTSRKIWLGALILLIIIAAVGYFKWLAIYDWSRLTGYTPPQQIVQFADQTTMTPYARHLFYVYHPAVQDSAAFNKNCKVTPQAVVLGCTVRFQGIYLYNVTNPRLDGIKPVTAAYEMLHVGYDRLSASERTRVDQLVMRAFESAQKTDPRLKAEEQSYLKTEGQDAVANELHSMMGTEVAKLPPQLEAYYQRYFTNRQAVIALKNQYQAVFLNEQHTVRANDKQLASWQTTIAAQTSSLSEQSQAIAAERSRLENLLSGGNTAAYNAGVPTLNARIHSYNANLASLRQLISKFNALVASRNNVAHDLNQLNQSISSQPLGNLPDTITTQ